MKIGLMKALPKSIACACLVLCVGLVARGQGGGVAGEAARGRETLAGLKMSEAETKPLADAFAEAEEAARRGYVHYALYRLLRARTQVGAFGYRLRRMDVAKQGTEAFEAEWRRVGAELDEKERRLASAARGRREAIAAAALVETLLTEVRPQYEAGRLYGLNTTLDNGLYYFGSAAANLDYALFLRGLELPSEGAAPRSRPLDAQLKRLEAETLAAYRKPGAAAQQQRFNAVNSTLKTAWDLNRERRYAGALLKYLDAARVLGQLAADSADAPAPAALKEKIAAARARLDAKRADHSVALIFWEMARLAVDHAEAGAGDPLEMKRAGVVVEAVLPRYFEYVSEVRR